MAEPKSNVTTLLDNPSDLAAVREASNLDDETLAALGYKQEFKRDLGILESFSVSFDVLGILPSIASTLTYGLGYAGTGGAVWSYLAGGICIQATAFSIAELCSSMPTAGGLYYASAAMAPEGWAPFFSWFVAWSNFMGFCVGPCSFLYALAVMITTAAEISSPTYMAKDWHVYLIMLLLLILMGIVSMQSTKVIGRINVVGSAWNLIMVIIFIAWLPAGSVIPLNDNRETWLTFENGTEWPIGWAFIMGFLTTLYTMAGYDAPFHLSEECSNSNIASPRAIVLTAQSGLWMGWACILVIAYTVKDISGVVNSQFGQPYATFLLQVLGKKSGLALLSLTMVAQFLATIGVTVAASRIVFSNSRDGAMPFSRVWATVDKRFKTPVFAVWGIIFISALIGLLLFAGPAAINAVFTIVAIGQYTSFTTPIALKLFFGHERFKPGPWHMGRFSKLVNAIAVGWWLLIVPALCFPAVKGADLTLVTMNWTCLIYGGAILLAMTWYAVDARKWFKGPRINVDHLQQPVLTGKPTQATMSTQASSGKE